MPNINLVDNINNEVIRGVSMTGKKDTSTTTVLRRKQKSESPGHGMLRQQVETTASAPHLFFVSIPGRYAWYRIQDRQGAVHCAGGRHGRAFRGWSAGGSSAWSETGASNLTVAPKEVTGHLDCVRAGRIFHGFLSAQYLPARHIETAHQISGMETPARSGARPPGVDDAAQHRV